MRKLILALALSALPLSAFADTASLTWQPPTQRVDNTSLPLSEIREYRIYWGLGTSFDNTVVISNPSQTSHVIEGLENGTYSFRMTAVDTDGLESAYSATASKEVLNVNQPPRPPVITGVD